MIGSQSDRDALENALLDLRDIAATFAGLLAAVYPSNEVTLPARGLEAVFNIAERRASDGVAAFERIAQA